MVSFSYRFLGLKYLFLGLVGLSGLPADNLMIKELDDETVRPITIGFLVGRGVEAVPLLIRALQDENPDRRQGAAVAIGRMALLAQGDSLQMLRDQAIPALRDAVRDEDKRVRVQAALAIWRVNRDAKEAVPTLVALLQVHDTRVFYHAADALGRIGPQAKDAVPVLIAHLDDENTNIRVWSGNALKEIDPKAASDLGIH